MDWSEAWVRGQADWQAFKRGRELRDAVAGLRVRDGIVTGVFSEGRRKLHCTACEEDGRLSIRCGCAANRAAGTICEHGVALALASLATRPADAAPPAAVPTGPVAARRIHLPADAARMLAGGKLRMRITRVEEDPDEADRRFDAFLARHGAAENAPLQVDAGLLGEWLESVAGHRRIVVDPDARPVRVVDEVLDPLPLAGSALDGDMVVLDLGLPGVVPFAAGDGVAAMIENPRLVRIGKLPVDAGPPDWLASVARLCHDGRLAVPLGGFLGQIDLWLDLFAAPAPGWLGRLRFVAAVPERRIRVEGSLNALEAVVELRYGDAAFTPDPELAARTLPRVEGDRILVRSRDRESEPSRRLRAAGWSEDGPGRFHLHDPDEVPLWLADELPALRRGGEVVLGERLRHVMGRLHVVSPRIELAAGGSLACEIAFQTGDGRVLDPAKIRAILRQGRRPARAKDGSLVVVRREVAETVEPLLADLGLVSTEQRIAITMAQRFALSELQEKILQGTEMTESKAVSKPPDPDLVQATLRPYQSDGVGWLCERLGELSGALLGDEMGLGKTIQTIAGIVWLKRKIRDVRILVLVPTSLIGNWERELAVFAPGLRVVRFTGPDRDARREEAADVMLTSYGTFQRDRAFHLGRRYDLVVCDEASLLRNPDSQVSRAVAQLDAERRLALSGTPVENKLEDLWSIFRFVAPGYLGGRKEFAARYGEDSPAERRRLALRISPYYLRRTKEQVAPDLPGKLVIDEWLDLSGPARALYGEVAAAGLEEIDGLESSGAARLHLFTVLLRLRQICLSPRLVDEGFGDEPVKVEWLRRLLEERHAEGGKTLVFSQFAGFLKSIEAGLPADRVFRLDGATRDRTELVREFQECRGSAVFLISLKAGGYGLNLTAADVVVHMDPWWNPAAENQATDRAHRIGQSKPVTVYRLLARDTVEERVRRIQATKAELGAVVDAGLPAAWTDADLRSLVS